MGLLRLLLSICVVVAHTQFIMGNGFIGGVLAVELFFIISGFYMSLILNEKYTGKGSYKLFITNRMLKIYPAYFIVIIASIIFSLYFLYKHGDGNAINIQFFISYFDSIPLVATIFLSLSNIFIFGQDVVMFLGITPDGESLQFLSNFRESNPQLFNFMLIPPAWSISIELMFYIIAPFLVRKSLIKLLILVISGFFLKYYLIPTLTGFVWDPWTYRFFPSEISYFLIGAISYKIYNKIKNKNTHYISIAIALTMFSMIFCYKYFYSSYSYFYMIIAAFISIPFIFNLTKKSRLDRYIGELSYPVYLIHYLIITLLYDTLIEYNMMKFQAEIVIFVSILSSIAMMHFVIKPIDKYRQRRVA